MPIHDWTRVTAGTFHDFHVGWIAEFRKVLNGGVLPPGYYAQAEQQMRGVAPDVLALHQIDGGPPPADAGFGAPEPVDADGGVAIAEAPPRVAVTESISEAAILAAKRRRVVIRHVSDDHVVALMEILSPGNKDSAGPMQALMDKAVAALQQGYHLLMIDLFPPGPADPRGLHDRVWRELEGGRFEPPAGKPLMLAAYRAAGGITAYVEAVAVGQDLPDMPLFLDPDHYVNVPLESTYRAAYEGVPRRWRTVIEGQPLTR